MQYILCLISQIIIDFIQITQSKCMKANNYQCVNCQLHFEVEAQYIEHYKSEHHRYNVKRKIIGLPPLSFEEYHLQFQDEKTSKQSVDQQFYCQICSKKFMNPNTYKQHIASKKHKQNRLILKKPQKQTMSKSSSQSQFQILGAQKPQTCIFCSNVGTTHHMKMQHSFPPFQDQCINYQGLISYLKNKTYQKLCCVYCDAKFGCQDSVKQHMIDVGHCKLDIERFNQYEKFYMWKILESSSEQEQQLTQEKKEFSPPKSEHSMSFQNLQHPTLQQLQQKRLDRIIYTPTGALINGKEVGYRHLKQYYKQYLNRQITNMRQKYQPAIQDSSHDWKNEGRLVLKAPKITSNVNCR